MHRKTRTPECVPLTSEGVLATNHNHALDLVLKFGNKHWSNSVDVQTVSEMFADNCGLYPVVLPGENVTVGDLWQATGRAHGATGSDGWLGLEVQHLPPQAIQVFHQCYNRWYQTISPIPASQYT